MNANKQDAGGLPEPELNPCRFCGGEVSPNRDPNTGFAWIECDTCYSRGPKYLIGHRQMVAADIVALSEIWNRRTGELCRAAPAGGGVERDADFYSAGYANGYKHATKDSARAGGDACVVCGSDEPYTGTCGSNDPRALCKRSPPAGSGEVLTADMTKALPGGALDETTFQQIEDALDRADAPMRDESGKWLTLSERIATLIRKLSQGAE